MHIKIGGEKLFEFWIFSISFVSLLTKDIPFDVIILKYCLFLFYKTIGNLSFVIILLILSDIISFEKDNIIKRIYIVLLFFIFTIFLLF
jgi:hypothetical protein